MNYKFNKIVSCILYLVFSLGTKYKIQCTVLLLATCYLLPVIGVSQTNVPPPHVINAAGGSAKVGGNYYGYNIGEPVVGTGNIAGSNYFTQGFLQPDYAIGTAFNATIFYGSESCSGANDGYIISNIYNNKGIVHYALSNTSDSTANMVGLSPGIYTLTIHDTANKPLTKVITIDANSGICPVSVYNAFSPNGDGLNDTWYIGNIEAYPNNHVYIFNRYGQQLWEGTGYNNTTVVWGGKLQGGDAMYAGTYFYVIDITGKKPMKGWVEITSSNK